MAQVGSKRYDAESMLQTDCVNQLAKKTVPVYARTSQPHVQSRNGGNALQNRDSPMKNSFLRRGSKLYVPGADDDTPSILPYHFKTKSKKRVASPGVSRQLTDFYVYNERRTNDNREYLDNLEDALIRDCDRSHCTDEDENLEDGPQLTTPKYKKQKMDTQTFTGVKYSDPDPDHLDPALRNFQFETQAYKDSYFQIGDLVYSPFGLNSEECSYYWGYIVKKRITKLDHNKYCYDVAFEDGDIETEINSQPIYSRGEFNKLQLLSKNFDENPPEGPPSKRMTFLIKKNGGILTGPSDEATIEDSPSASNAAVESDASKSPWPIQIDDESQHHNSSPCNRLESNSNSASWDTPDIPGFLPTCKSSPVSLKQLYACRCRKCARCRAPDCGICVPCFHNTIGCHERVVCIRKICSNVRVQKHQQIPGFPPGWTFVFEDRIEPNRFSSKSIHPDLSGLLLTSPRQKKFTSIAGLLEDSNFPGIQRGLKTFYNYLGTRLLEEVYDHPLLNRRLVSSWLDSAGRTRYLVGTVTKAEFSGNDGDIGVTATVHRLEYENTRIQSHNFVASPLPSRIVLSDKAAWESCLAYEAKKVISDAAVSPLLAPRDTFRHKWIIPSQIKTGIDRSVEPSGLPWMECTIDELQLKFMVKPSTIQGVKFGVFVSCTTEYSSSSRKFTLEAGHMIDCGVFAPFLSSDVKRKAEFMAKNFIFSFDPEKFVCKAVSHNLLPPRYLDITDDLTGKLHSSAKGHIAPYVNRVFGAKAAPDIHAYPDHENVIHYMLGHLHQSDGPYTLQLDGKFREIFVEREQVCDETCIMRSNQPGLPEETVDGKSEESEALYLDQIEYWDGNAVIEAFEFIDKIWVKIKDPNVIVKAIVLLFVLKERAMRLREKYEELIAICAEENGNPSDDICDNGASKLSELNISELIQILLDKVGDIGTLVVCRHPAFQKAAGLNVDLKSMSAKEFRQFITRAETKRAIRPRP